MINRKRGITPLPVLLIIPVVWIVTSLHQCHPELVSGSQKLRRFRNMSWIIGRSAGSTQLSLGRVSLSLNSYQNPQFGMTINKISPSPHPSPTRGEGIKPPPRNQRFRPSRKGWTFCAFSLLFTPISHTARSFTRSYFAGSTSVPTPPPRRWEGIKSIANYSLFTDI